MDSPKLLAQGVSKTLGSRFQHLDTLASFDLVVTAGEFVSIIGPSGCGKSTLFTIIAGVEKSTSGTISIDGEASIIRAGKTGYMQQQSLLLPWRTVEEYVITTVCDGFLIEAHILSDTPSDRLCVDGHLPLWHENPGRSSADDEHLQHTKRAFEQRKDHSHDTYVCH